MTNKKPNETEDFIEIEDELKNYLDELNPNPKNKVEEEKLDIAISWSSGEKDKEEIEKLYKLREELCEKIKEEKDPKAKSGYLEKKLFIEREIVALSELLKLQ